MALVACIRNPNLPGALASAAQGFFLTGQSINETGGKYNPLVELAGTICGELWERVGHKAD